MIQQNLNSRINTIKYFHTLNRSLHCNICISHAQLTSGNLDQLKDFKAFPGWGIFFFMFPGPRGAPGGGSTPPKGGIPGGGGGPPGGRGGGGGGNPPNNGRGGAQGGGGGPPMEPSAEWGRGPPGAPGGERGAPGTPENLALWNQNRNWKINYQKRDHFQHLDKIITKTGCINMLYKTQRNSMDKAAHAEGMDSCRFWLGSFFRIHFPAQI